MAEKGAHLTPTAQSRPSLFDFVAQESFNSLLYPSTKKILDVLLLPNHFCIKWFDEWFLLTHSILQYYYLKKYGATFSEKFYGLQRIPIHLKKHSLGSKELYLSLAAVSLFSYLRKKLGDKADAYAFSTTQQGNKLVLMKSVIYMNKFFNIFYQLLKVIQHLRFISGKTDINSPLLWLAGVQLKYAEENPALDALTFRNFILQFLQRSLEIGAFFIQFLQWWQTEKSSSLNIVPCPPPPQKSEDGVKFSSKCPICLRKRNIDTVLSTSGFVFCFKCITAYLMEHNQCPVTKLPATVHNLIRIYPPT